MKDVSLPIIQCFALLCSQAIRRGCGVRLIVLAATGVLLLVTRMALMGGLPPDFAPSDNPAASTDKFLTRLLTFLYLPVVNFWMLLCPRILSFDWSMDAIPLIESIWDPRNVVSLIFYGSSSSLGIHLLKIVMKDESLTSDIADVRLNNNIKLALHKKGGYDDNRNRKSTSSLKHSQFSHAKIYKRTESHTSKLSNSFISATGTQREKVVLVAMAILVISFIPATNLFFYVGFVMAERILYIPSLGFCLLGGIGIERLYDQAPSKLMKKVVSFCVCALVIVSGIKTVMRNKDWRDEESLYRSGIDVIPAKGE